MGGKTGNPPSTYPKLAAHPVGQHIRSIYKDRLGQFSGGGQYESKNLRAMMEEGRASGDDSVKLSVYSPPDLARPTFKEATSQEFKPTKKGESFGPSWSTHWIKVQLRVPAELRKKRHLELHWDANNEGLIWSKDGIPLQGLTGGGERTEWILPEEFRDGKEHLFYIEMACNGMFGNAPGGDSIQPPNPNKYFQLSEADIVAVNLDARALFVDFWIIGDASREFPGDGWESHEAQNVCNEIMDVFELGNQDSIIKGREIAQRYLGKNVDSSKVYENDNEAIVSAIGHCHIDTCWLWPWAETKRKVARSWANQCDLMDRYPEHRFTCSQAQQYKWLEQLYPPLFDRVKGKVKKGTFQPIGGSWVEHDTNMPSGESLVRQFLYGQRFFESRFGERCTTFWLPDTFGYSGQLPQLCRLAGMSRFFTQKLSWNNINNFPHTTFNWVALDGSQVLCHMAPSNTYTAEAHFGDVKRSVTQHKSMDQDKTSLLVFGKGDGGGGPTFQHLEKLRRCRAISDKIGLLPRVKMGDSVDDFFERLEKKAEDGTEFVTWYGELYFELHRGTYTTQANNKYNNRKSEVLLRDVEYLATLASLKGAVDGSKSAYKYPKKTIDEMWEKVLLCQFHDCLPGSSIEMCYDDSDELYTEVFGAGKKCIQDALAAMGYRDALANEKPEVILSTLAWPRTETVILPDTQNSSVMAATWQKAGVSPGQPKRPLIGSARVLQLAEGGFQLSNADFDVLVSDSGVITSLYDKKNEREVIAKGGKANQLVIFDDKPLYWQAWDVEVYHLDSRKELKGGKTVISEEGPERVSVVTSTKISAKSTITTKISLKGTITAGGLRDGKEEAFSPTSSFVEMEAEVDWHEDMKFLKVEFPVDIRNTEASYETQFGIIRRPTHYNTSWDMAKFEVCCHKFADLSEANYGVSILNDSKYGFATCGNLMRLSLLRAPKAPDAHADMGKHTIRYAILPHKGPLGPRTVRTAYEFNSPIRLLCSADSAKKPKPLPIVHLTGDEALVLDTIKRGEDDDDVSRGELPRRKGQSVIVRIYESLGGTSRGTIETDLPVQRVWKCNLLEDDEAEVSQGLGYLESGGRTLAVELRPFEVATYRLQL